MNLKAEGLVIVPFATEAFTRIKSLRLSEEEIQQLRKLVILQNLRIRFI